MGRPSAILEEAKAQMRSQGKFGIVLRVPPPSPTRHDLGHAIEGLVNSEDLEVARLLESTVFVCLESDAFSMLLPGIPLTDTLIVLNPDGIPFRSVSVNLERLGKKEGALARSVKELVPGARLGEGGS